MRLTSKAALSLCAAAGLCFTLARGATAVPDSAPVVTFGSGSNAVTGTAGDFRALFATPADSADSNSLRLFADYLLKLADARNTFGDISAASDSLRRIAEGSAVYDIMQLRTIGRARADSAGAERFFLSRRADYSWARPHFFGTIVIADSDSAATAAAEALRAAGCRDMDAMAIRRTAIRLFGKSVGVVTVRVARGANPWVDRAVFAGPVPAPEDGRTAAAAVYGMVLTAPRTAADAGAPLLAAFADSLATAWVDSLRHAAPPPVFHLGKLRNHR